MIPIKTNTICRLSEVQMERTSSPDDPSAYLENLMHAGQQSMKRFDDALATAMGVVPVVNSIVLAVD
jgi:hypothetical protein